MIVGIVKMTFRASWVHTLKEKRMVVRSIIGRTKARFNVSIAEIEALDEHKRIIIGMSQVANNEAKLDSMIEEIIHFMENSTEAELLDIEVQHIIF